MTDLSQINLIPKTLEEAIETIGHVAKIILELKAENALLKEENARLKEQLNINSKNSSLSPSRDLKKKKQSKPKSARKPGGQPGHKGHQRALVPIEEVNAAGGTHEIIFSPPKKSLTKNSASQVMDYCHSKAILNLFGAAGMLTGC